MKYYTATFVIHATEEAETAGNKLIQTARELLAGLVADAGFEAFEDTERGINGYVPAELFDADALRRAVDALPLYGVKVDYTVCETEDIDYNKAWEEAGFEPIVIRDKICVHDARRGTADLPYLPVDITIDTEQAFGTGTHETTQMIIDWLASEDIEGKRVLDCGCGTGILSITASKLGAAGVTAYDIDDWSVRNTTHNASVNHADNINVLQGDASVIDSLKGSFHVIMANINRNTLLNDMPAFRKALAEDGRMVLSGFYPDDADMIVEKAESLGLVLDSLTSGEWCMLSFVPADA